MPVFTKNLFVLIAILFVLFIAVSCSEPGFDVSDDSPTPMLFDKADENESLDSGNMFYGQFLVSDGDNIYYISKGGEQLIKATFDDAAEVVISYKTPYTLSYTNGTVFFISGSSGGPIYKVDTDGNGETMITDNTAIRLISTLTDVFYISSQDNLLYRIAHDGSKKTLLFSNKVSLIMHIGEILYFIPADEPGKVYSLTSGQITTMVSGNSIPASSLRSYDTGIKAVSVNITSDALFFTDENYTGIYSMPFGGKAKKILHNQLSAPFIVNNGYIYFIDPAQEYRLYRSDIQYPDSIELVANDKVSGFTIIGNSVFYFRENRFGIYRVSVAGGFSEKIA